MNKKRLFTLFFFLLHTTGTFLFGQDLSGSRWYLSNTHPEGVRELYLYLGADGLVELHYYQPDTYRLKEEEWYRINDKRLIIQDYMGEFVVLNILDGGEFLEINSPVEYFTGTFRRLSESEWNDFMKKMESKAENR